MTHKKMRQLTILLMALVCAFGASAQTDNAKYNEELDKVLSTTISQDYFSNTLETQFQALVKNGMMTQEKSTLICAELSKELYPLILGEIRKLYAENYTYDELKELYKFISSPLGQKNILVTHKMTSQMTEFMQKPEIMSKVQEIIMKNMK